MSDMPPENRIFLYRHGAGINPQQLQKLRREGFIPVGVKYMSDAKVLAASTAFPEIHTDILILAAARAATRSASFAQYFGEEIAKLLIAQDAGSKA